MNPITCYDVKGKAVAVAPDSVLFRPAVYGILIESRRVLLARHPQTSLWQPPGSILASRSTPAQALRQQFRQLTGVSPNVSQLLLIEDQYRVDESEHAFHLSIMFYALERPGVGMATLAESEGVPQAEFVSLDELHRDQMQFGYEAVQAGQLRLELRNR